MKLLVTGAGGQVGHEVVALALASGHEVHAIDRLGLDITDLDAVVDRVEVVRPDAIVNAAGFTDVDGCEHDPERASAVNADAVGYLRNAAEAVGAHLTTISTDYVFDGTKTDPYTELDTPAPRSVYGESKLSGERLAGPESTVVRTSWVFGEVGRNVVKTVLRLLAGPGPLTFVDDQRGCPTGAADLATALLHLSLERRSGLFHATNSGPVSWFEFAHSIALRSGHDPERVVPCSTAELTPPRPAARPANSVLANDALVEIGFPPLRDHREALDDVLAALAR